MKGEIWVCNQPRPVGNSQSLPNDRAGEPRTNNRMVDLLSRNPIRRYLLGRISAIAAIFAMSAGVVFWTLLKIAEILGYVVVY